MGGQDKKKRRLQKNRESARECRRRQRAHAEELASRVSTLQADNRHLQSQLQSVQQRVKGQEKQKLCMESEMEEMLQRNCPEEEMESYLENFKDCYADYGEQRRKEVKFHLQQLEALLLPTQTTKMSLWTLEQDENFFRDTGRASLSAILLDTLGISTEQTSKIQSRRERIRELVGHLKKSLGLLERLKENVEDRHERFDRIMTGMQALLTPTQRAKLVLWATRNEPLLSSSIPGFTKNTFGMELTTAAVATPTASPSLPSSLPPSAGLTPALEVEANALPSDLPPQGGRREGMGGEQQQ